MKTCKKTKRRGTVPHTRAAHHKLIRVLGICKSLWLSWLSRGSGSVSKALVVSASPPLQNPSVLPIIVTGSHARLCFALTYCPHHVVCALSRVCQRAHACACVCQNACHNVCGCIRLHTRGRCLYALHYVLVEVAGGGSAPTSHGPGGLDLPFQRCLRF